MRGASVRKAYVGKRKCTGISKKSTIEDSESCMLDLRITKEALMWGTWFPRGRCLYFFNNIEIEVYGH